MFLLPRPRARISASRAQKSAPLLPFSLGRAAPRGPSDLFEMRLEAHQRCMAFAPASAKVPADWVNGGAIGCRRNRLPALRSRGGESCDAQTTRDIRLARAAGSQKHPVLGAMRECEVSEFQNCALGAPPARLKPNCSSVLRTGIVASFMCVLARRSSRARCSLASNFFGQSTEVTSSRAASCASAGQSLTSRGNFNARTSGRCVSAGDSRHRLQQFVVHRQRMLETLHRHGDALRQHRQGPSAGAGSIAERSLASRRVGIALVAACTRALVEPMLATETSSLRPAASSVVASGATKLPFR